MLNPITLIDGYKLDHRRQYPEGTQFVYSNWTPRGSRVAGVTDVTLFGLQYFLDRYLMDEFDNDFFDGNVNLVCKQYERRVNGYLGPNSVGTDHIRALHELGYLPLEFRAIPEGSSVPLRVPMLTVENTHPDFGWLVNYFETIMSNVLWLPCTSATTAKHFRKMLDFWAEKTGTDQAFVDWQGHDFSFRGMAGPEAAALSGAGHLISFTGTDTIPAIDLVEDYYPTDGFVGGSVAATEHSVMCAGGEKSEMETFLRLIDLYPAGVLSVVSDTWDFWGVLTELLPQIKDKVLARDGKLVIRPDSGDPVKIVAGDPDAFPGTPEYKGAVEVLWDLFGGTVTDKGYKLLDGHIGVIYGDSITYERGEQILAALAQKGFASGNVVLGIGSYTYQYVTRDTFGFAMKATWVQINGEGMAIFKDPKTDNGLKKSAKGRLAVLDYDGKVVVVDDATPEQEAASLLQPVWKDGKFVKGYTFDEVRANAKV